MLYRRFAFLVLLLIFLLGSACGRVDSPPGPEEVVVLIEDDNSDEVMALYLDSELLEKHGVSADEFREAYSN